ncbi:ATP-binding protein [Polyangium sp. 15x6]|uniref:ATP-binding protein n=1 Tax=Polyangium sp. 15x6 TaxID=3042687 RepID=UPI00249AB86F|nr:ATP-binding protein [Polyangium sp. 15x6]MDI3287432.1 ATP-binding protein [Polyangium sp. 15x6]
MSTQDSRGAPRGPSLSELLRDLEPEILAKWEQAVRKLPVARSLARPVLMDHVPELLERIAEMVDQMAAGRPPEPLEEAAESHARDRLEAGFDLGEVVAEYAALRATITKHFLQKQLLVEYPEALSVLNWAIDTAVATSVDRYTRASRRTLEALDRISTASLEARSLNELLQRLLGVFLGATASVDTAVILLCEDDILRVRAAVGLEEEVSQGFSLKVGEGFAGTIATEQRPIFLRNASEDPLVKSPILRAKGVKALYGVPLVDGARVLGVAHMGSRSTSEFSEQDKHLFGALAGRATTAISQSMLRERLEVERARLAAVVEQMPAGVVLAEAPSGRMIMGNRQVAEIWRRPFEPSSNIEEYRTWRGFHLVNGRPLNPKEWALARAILNGETVRQELRILRGDGTYGFILNTGAPIRDSAGRIVAAVAALVDITDRKRAEEERERLITEIDFERIRYLDLINNLDHVVVWEADPNSLAFSFVSSRAATATGFTAEEWKRSPKFWAARVPQEDLDALLSHFRRCQDEESPAPFDHRFLRRDGRVSWLRTGVHLLRTGHRAHLVGVSMDVTELKAAIGARDQVLAIVSHDLRNPLASIMGAVQFLTLRAASDEVYACFRKPADIISRAAQQMARMISDIMDVSSIETGHVTVVPAPEHPYRLATEAMAGFHDRAREKGVSLRSEIAAELPRVHCDRDRVMQVFANLISNAIQVTDPGGSIVLQAEARGKEVAFSVSDTGRGIPANEIGHLFQPYWRSTRSGYKGSGLGLAIVQGFVAAHGGKVWVESAIDKGTTFFFTLPVEGAEPREGLSRAA